MSLHIESEGEFAGRVVSFAYNVGRWDGYHVLDSRRCLAGFPDWVFKRDPKRYAFCLFVCELKREDGDATREQIDWLNVFRASGVRAFLWRPSDWPEIEATVTEGTHVQVTKSYGVNLAAIREAERIARANRRRGKRSGRNGRRSGVSDFLDFEC